MTSPKTLEDLNRLIRDGVEENQQLEYKAAAALDAKDVAKEIGKDVSAMANASGGIIIYGIKEHNDPERKHLPESITPIMRDKFSKERLEQIINSNVYPKIEGVLIHPIQLEISNHGVYVVEIPQSATAHQNAKDFLYYKRYNFQVLPMQDYEIRDVMNRLSHPKVEIQFELQKVVEVSLPAQDFGNLRGYNMATGNATVIPKLTLRLWPSNNGTKYAMYINYFIDIPAEIVDEDEAELRTMISDTHLRVFGENTVRDLLDTMVLHNSVSHKYGPSRYDPLLPGLQGHSKTIKLKPDAKLNEREISWDVYADNAPINHGKIRLSEINVVEKDPL